MDDSLGPMSLPRMADLDTPQQRLDIDDSRASVESHVPHPASIMASLFSTPQAATPLPSHPSPSQQNAMNPAKLRDLVKDSIEKHMYKNACVFADLLVTLTGVIDDVYLLARSYYLDRQFRRAVHLLKVRDLVSAEGDVQEFRFQYLGALCLFECQEWEECLSILGEDEQKVVENQEGATHSMQAKELGHSSGIDIRASISLLRGKVYEALENRQRAIAWYKQALRWDVKCVEALTLLVDKRMLKYSEERSLLTELHFPAELSWLKLLYQTKLQQYDPSCHTTVDQHVQTLDTEYGLKSNLDLIAGVAEHHYYRNDFRRCYDLAKMVIDQDPYHQSILPAYVCCLVELEMKSELFYCAHQLVEAYPNKAVSWFSVGCYYFLITKFELARRFFSKSTSIDHHFAPGWIGFGNAFAAADESDQAMAAYRTAARLFEGSHIPLLCIGMEYLRTNNLGLASQFFRETYAACPTDPLIFNEMGVIAYRKENYSRAVEFFQKALELSAKEATDLWEPTLFNLGQTFRKLKEYEESIRYYKLAVSVCPKEGSIVSALGFAYHLKGDVDTAIQYYHKALGLQPRDTFTSDMLKNALEELMEELPELPGETESP